MALFFAVSQLSVSLIPTVPHTHCDTHTGMCVLTLTTSHTENQPSRSSQSHPTGDSGKRLPPPSDSSACEFPSFCDYTLCLQVPLDLGRGSWEWNLPLSFQRSSRGIQACLSLLSPRGVGGGGYCHPDLPHGPVEPSELHRYPVTSLRSCERM